MSIKDLRTYEVNPFDYPFDYLKDLFTRLPSAKITEIKQFTPSEWTGSCQTRLDLFCYGTSRTR